MQHHNSSGLVHVFSARACAAPLEKAAKLFEQRTGVTIEISVCSRHCAKPVAEEATGETGGDDFLLEIADAGIHDLAISGAEYLLDDGEVRGIVQRGKRRTIGYRTSAILVPAGNPKDIRSVQDMARPGMRIGVSTSGTRPHRDHRNAEGSAGGQRDMRGHAVIRPPARHSGAVHEFPGLA